MEYTITAKNENGQSVEWITVRGDKKAAQEAVKMAKENPKCNVFVEWFRKSDGQHGYLNPGRNHDITGQAW